MKKLQNRVMVVDDEEFCLSSMKSMLKLAGIDVKQKCDVFITGKESLDYLKKMYKQGYSYSYIFTDFSMPVMNGIESTRQMRQFLETEMKISRENQPIIVGVTGHSNQQFRDEGLQAGMDEVQSKPFYLAAIKEVISRYNRNL